jgi:hypothetical protein
MGVGVDHCATDTGANMQADERSKAIRFMEVSPREWR